MSTSSGSSLGTAGTDDSFSGHGDESSAQDLSSALYHDFNMRTFAPKDLETFRFV